MHYSNKITGVILAGGKGRRMGGIDKGLVEFKGQALIEPIIAALTPHVDQLMINANRNISNYEKFGYTVINDGNNHYFGPLAGFLAAMKVAKNEQLIFVPCDGPFLKEELVNRLIYSHHNSRSEIVVAHDGARIQPVYVSVLKNLEHSLETYLVSGERKIDRWYQQHDYKLVDCSDILDCFININTLDERSCFETKNNKRKAT